MENSYMNLALQFWKEMQHQFYKQYRKMQEKLSSAIQTEVNVSFKPPETSYNPCQK